MKKLMTILVVFALCGVAMAQTVNPNKPVDLTMNTETKTTYETVGGKEITKQQYNKLSQAEKQYVTVTTTGSGWNQTTTYYYNEHQVPHTTTEKVATTHDYLNVKEDGTLGTSGLTYTVTASREYGEVRGYDRQIAQGYFTVTENVPAGKVVAVQFLGAEPEFGTGHSAEDSSFRVTDYGIYLYNPETGMRTSDYMSVTEYGNYFGTEAEVTAGTTFGVYFKDENGNIIASTGDGMKNVTTREVTGYTWYGNPIYEYTTTLQNAENGMLGNFDDDSHELKVYDAVTHEKTIVETDKHFLCLSSGEYDKGNDAFKIAHFEFMLQTTIDDPYFPVNPNDFNDDVHIDDPVVNGDMSGQPLPGTLATILISSLCAGALRKKNSKKH